MFSLCLSESAKMLCFSLHWPAGKLSKARCPALPWRACRQAKFAFEVLEIKFSLVVVLKITQHDYFELYYLFCVLVSVVTHYGCFRCLEQQ